MTAFALSELVGPPATGRVFRQELRPGFADVTPTGRVRLDGLARWLQDVAYADVEDAGLHEAAVWVLRRTRIQVRAWPRFGARCLVSTYCSGMGRMWAERRTSISALGSPEASVEAVALWVHLDPVDWRPTPLGQAELELYRPSASGRRVTARLRHRAPEEDAPWAPWRFRVCELDIASHINNSAYWQPLEEELMQADEPASIDVEIEFRTPAQPGEKRVVGDEGPLRPGARRWILDAGGEVHASALVAELAGV